MTITVYIGNNDTTLSDTAKKHDCSAYLIHKGNYKEFLEQCPPNTTVYTSLTDVPKINNKRCVLYDILQKADNIVFCQPSKWSDDNGEFNLTSQQMLIEYFLLLINNRKNNVVGLMNIAKNKYLNLEEKRTSTSNVLWVAGCSISYGVGVLPTEKFGTIIAKTLAIPMVNIAKGGSSIEYASDQILRSDIQKGDIVVWGLTSEYRAPSWNHGAKAEKNSAILTEETRMYKAVTSVYQVINFCNKLKVKLILLPLICSEQLRVYLNNEKDFYQLPYQTEPLDYGTDNVHPGIKQHKFWADFCIDSMNLK